MKFEKGICSGCNKERYIQNKKKNLCNECVYKLNHGGKSKQEVQYEKIRDNNFNRSSSWFRYDSNVNLEKRTKTNGFNKSRIKKTGEKQLFEEIWAERPHICTNCEKSLGDEPKVYFFAHIKSKGSSSKLRLDKKNIRLLCWDCHYAHDHQGKEAFNKRTKTKSDEYHIK